MKRFLILITLLALSGCGTLGKIDLDSASTRFVVQYAALKYVESSTGIDAAKAVRVYGHVTAVRGYLERSNRVSVVNLETYIINRVDWTELTPADTIAARAFISYLSAELESRIQADYELDRLVVARDLVDLVAQTLEPYAK